MQLPNPVPGVDPGPDYANNLTNSLNIVDRHNHSPGNGVLINPSGLNINADLPFGSNNAILLRSVRFAPQPSPLAAGTDLGCLYVSGVDLYYNDVNGNQIKITASGTVNATSSGIVSGSASAAFSGGVLVVKSSVTSGANVLLQSVQLTNSGNLTNILTLQAPTLSGSSSLTLPVVPASTKIMRLDASGNISATLDVDNTTIDVAANLLEVKDGGITNPKLAPLGQQVSGSVTFSTTSASSTPVTGLTVTITTTGRPVIMGLFSNGASSALVGIGGTAGTLYSAQVLFTGGLLSNNQMTLAAGTAIPASSFTALALTIPANTYTFSVQASVTAGGTIGFTNVSLYAYEL